MQIETNTTCNSITTHFSNRSWYCSLCDKNMNVKSKTGKINSNFHKRRERFAFTVRKQETDNTEITRKDNIPEDVIKDHEDKYLHTFD